MSQQPLHQINQDQDPTQRQAIAPNLAVHDNDIINSLGHVGVSHTEQPRFNARKLLAGVSMFAVGVFGAFEPPSIEAEAYAASKVPAKTAQPFKHQEARTSAKAETAQAVPSVWSMIPPTIEAGKKEFPSPQWDYLEYPEDYIKNGVMAATLQAGDGSPVRDLRTVQKTSKKYVANIAHELRRPVIAVAAFQEQYDNDPTHRKDVGMAVNPAVLINEVVIAEPVVQSATNKNKFIKAGPSMKIEDWGNLAKAKASKLATNQSYKKDPLQINTVEFKTYKKIANSVKRAKRFLLRIRQNRKVRDQSTDPSHVAGKYVSDLYFVIDSKREHYGKRAIDSGRNIINKGHRKHS